MRNIKFIVTVLVLMLSVHLSFAQDGNKKEQEEKIRAQKIAFFTDKIGLTPGEAQDFWPIYNSYWNKKNSIIADRKKTMTDFMAKSEQLSKKEMINYANKYINYEMQLAKLLEEYHLKFKQILPIEKVMKIYLADYEFKTYLLKKIRGDKDDK